MANQSLVQDLVPQQTLRWEATIQGTLLRVRRIYNWSHSTEPPKRGIIKGFTKPARLRLLRTIARIDWPQVGESVLITLTYPDVVKDRKYTKRTQDRNLFIRHLEKYWARPISVLWRLEWKERQTGQCKGQMAPHFHLLPFGVRFVPWQDVRGWWRAILGHTGPIATDVRRTNSGEHTAKYAAKYAAKEASVGSLDNESYLDMTGRSWNLTRKNLVPWAREKGVTDLDADQLHRAMSVAASFLGKEYLGSFYLMSAGVRVLMASILGIPESALDKLPDYRG